ncbi:hypothetical protein HAX54_041020 [Datura stramonium]|uniref:Uncharacterized protein n=1 Tax=Datura stramonium TaxID=4076 RepID=A0ABS8VPT4_DATST|nr:hypothetical protein [Datura stramonium]
MSNLTNLSSLPFKFGQELSLMGVRYRNPFDAMGLGDTIKSENKASNQNRAKAMIFLRHHIDRDFFEHPEEKIDHLIDDGYVAMEE